MVIFHGYVKLPEGIWYLLAYLPDAHTKVKLSNSLPTTCFYVCVYIYNPLYTPDQPSAISYACILPIYYLHAIYLLEPIYYHYLEALYRIYILSIYYLYATSILSYIFTTCLISLLSHVFCIFNMYVCVYIYI